MSEITMIGLGLMGAAMARRVRDAGHALTVWNRSRAKAEALVQAGATARDEVAQAVGASPLVVICVESYEVTYAILDREDVRRRLRGRTVVQLSTGTPRDAVEADGWFREREAIYIDGAVLGGPSSLDSYAEIVFCGPRAPYDAAARTLRTLAAGTRYVGEKINAAATLDLGWLCRHYGMFLGMTHAAVLCEAEGIGLEELARCLPEGEYAHHFIRQIHRGDFENTTATLATWASAFDNIARQARDSGINDEMPQLMASWFSRSLEAGLGEEDVTALVKTLRRRSNATVP